MKSGKKIISATVIIILFLLSDSCTTINPKKQAYEKERQSEFITAIKGVNESFIEEYNDSWILPLPIEYRQILKVRVRYVKREVSSRAV